MIAGHLLNNRRGLNVLTTRCFLRLFLGGCCVKTWHLWNHGISLYGGSEQVESPVRQVVSTVSVCTPMDTLLGLPNTPKHSLVKGRT